MMMYVAVVVGMAVVVVDDEIDDVIYFDQPSILPMMLQQPAYRAHE